MSNLIDENGVTTAIDATISFLGGSFGFNTSGTASEFVPQHIPDLNELDGFNRYTTAVEVEYADLTPGEEYGIYLFGLENDGTLSFSQTVTITGAAALPSFQQVLSDGQMMVNGQLGSDAQTLQSFELLATADGGGMITIDIVPDVGSDRQSRRAV